MIFSTKASQMAVYLGIWKKKEKYCTPLVVALWNMMPCFTVIIIINSETTTCVVISEELLFRCCYHWKSLKAKFTKVCSR